MKHFDLIFLPFAIMALAVLCWAVWAIKAFTKPLKTEDIIPCDDIPGDYDEIEFSERPYIEMI